MIVLDTHVIIWDALRPELLSPGASQAITQANNEDGLIICEISYWEIAMLIKKGRIQIDTSYQAFIDLVLQSNKFVSRGITPQIAELSTQFPPDVNQDPADRIIAATAMVENAPLVTADKNL